MEHKDVRDVSTGSSASRSRAVPPWIWAVAFVGNLIILTFLFLHFSHIFSVKPACERAFKDYGAYIISGIVVFFTVVFVLAWRQSREVPEGLTPLVDMLGVTLTRRWGSEGLFGNVSIGGSGPYFEGLYGDVRIACVSVWGHGFSTRLSVYHRAPLRSGFLCRFNASPLTLPQTLDEYKDLFARRVEMRDKDLKCWAVEHDKVSRFFNQGDAVRDMLVAIKDYLKAKGGMLIVNDRKITVMVLEPAHLTKDLVDSICAASRSLVSLASIAPSSAAWSKAKIAGRLFNAVLVILIAALVLAVIWEITIRL